MTLDGALDLKRYERCLSVGHDRGGAIACAFAIARLRRLYGLVMVNAIPPAIYRRELVENPGQQTTSAYMSFFNTDHAPAAQCADDFA